MNRNKNPSITFTISTSKCLKTVFFFLLATALFFVFLDLTVNYGKWAAFKSIRRLCNLAREDSLAAWFASAQTLVTAFCLWAVAYKTRAIDADQWKFRGWVVTAAFFTYMAIDDAAAVHERIGTAVDDFFKRPDEMHNSFWLANALRSFPSYTWQIVMGPFFVLMGFFLLVFLQRELKDRGSRWRALGGLSCFALAFCFDYVEGRESLYPALAQAVHISTDAFSHFLRVIEETLELIGTSFFLLAFLSQLVSGTDEFRIVLSDTDLPS